MSNEDEAGRHRSAREEFQEARDRYHQLRQQERDLRQQAREQEREAHRTERIRTRDERRTLHDQIRQSVHEGLGHDLGRHIGRTIKDSMSFAIDLGDMDVGGEEYAETIERDFAVGPMPGLHVRNVSGDTKIAVGEDGKGISMEGRTKVARRSDAREAVARLIFVLPTHKFGGTCAA